MSGRFKNKVAIITGGSKGIGEGCVRVFREYQTTKLVICEPTKGRPDGWTEPHF